jgi:D-cysteine desulfhydrase
VTLPLLEFLPNPPARLALGRFPSPLEEAPSLADVLGLERLLIKRDDANGAPFGGNKLRALEWLLPAAGPRVVTMGGYGSTWCAALATLGCQHAIRVFPALFPQPWTPTVAGTLTTTVANGAVELAASRARLPLAIARAWRRARREGPVRWLPAGGATPLAMLGSINAALEFTRQLETLPGPPPQAIVVPFGSGGTAAGLLVGAWLAGWDGEILAVRVTDPWFASRRRLLALAGRGVRVLADCGRRVTPGRASVRVIDGYLGAGYGHPSAGGTAAIHLAQQQDITLDPTYGAKAFAALRPLATSFRRLCFWHTFDRRLLHEPAHDHLLLREARLHAESLWPHQKST